METYKHTMFFSAVMIIILITAVFLIFGPKDESYYIDYMVNRLQRYGVFVDKIPIERVMVEIPNPLDKIYLNYNVLQKKAGYDLEKYKGKTVWRYTYRVNNIKSDGEVRANILFYKSKIIGGDIMSTSLNGFMYPVNFKELQN